MARFTEPRHTGEHVVSEANGYRSRAEAILAAGNLAAGTVLAENADGDYVQVALAASDGTETAKAVLYSAADATDGPVPCVVHLRDCEVHGEGLTWTAEATDEQIQAGIDGLADSGVIVR